MPKQQFVIGVDGGGTKITAALADLSCQILKISKGGPASPRNLGIRGAIDNVAKTIKELSLKERQIASVFVGLPGLEEEFKNKKEEIKKEVLKHKKISKIFKGKIIIGSDQLVAFKSGTDEEDGVILISGTGCVARGWKGAKEAKASGWGWLADEGSAFWAGQKVYQEIIKSLDGSLQKARS